MTSTPSLTAIHRYPVKSMMGESLNAAAVGPRGLIGDRQFALGDPATGKIVSAKNPGKWPGLFNFRAAFAPPSAQGPVSITLPDGHTVSSDHPELGAILSSVLGRAVTLLSASPAGAELEEYWPDMEELPHRGVITDEKLPPGTFFDCATVHLLTTATLDELRSLHPAGRIEPRRFRPNLIVSTPPEMTGFVENDWIGKEMTIGPEVRLKITGACPRCVMTTLAQDDLPRDPAVLRTAARHNSAHVGVYASVLSGGNARRGDPVVVHEPLK